MNDYRMGTKCVQAGYTPGNGEPRSAPNCLINADPQFVDISKWDYHLKSTSMSKGAGIEIPGVIQDLDGLIRGNPPTIGCYEVF